MVLLYFLSACGLHEIFPVELDLWRFGAFYVKHKPPKKISKKSAFIG